VPNTRNVVLSGLAVASVIATGCGKSSTTSARPTPAGAPGKLTPAQKKDLLVKNNSALIGTGGYDKVEANYRAAAKPLAPGACKRSLETLAAAEAVFGEALGANKPLAVRQRLGQTVLKAKGRTDAAC